MSRQSVAAGEAQPIVAAAAAAAMAVGHSSGADGTLGLLLGLGSLGTDADIFEIAGASSRSWSQAAGA